MRPPRFVISITFAIALAVACAPEQLAGTDLGAQEAPPFVLTDGATGSPVALTSLRGNVVALAFLYTRCPDVCPLTAEQFRQAQTALGSGVKAQFIAVSVDPDGDTPQRVRDFSAAHRLDHDWHFLIGPRSVLGPVWDAYGMRVEPDPSGAGAGHTDAIFLIDRKGRARVLLHTIDGADKLTKDIKILANEAS